MFRTRAPIVALVVSAVTVAVVPGVAVAGGDSPEGECGGDCYVPEDPDCDGEYERPEQETDDDGVVALIVAILALF